MYDPPSIEKLRDEISVLEKQAQQHTAVMAKTEQPRAEVNQKILVVESQIRGIDANLNALRQAPVVTLYNMEGEGDWLISLDNKLFELDELTELHGELAEIEKTYSDAKVKLDAVEEAIQAKNKRILEYQSKGSVIQAAHRFRKPDAFPLSLAASAED